MKHILCHVHTTKLRLYDVKNLCQLDTALEALWSRVKWIRFIWESQLTLMEKHQWKLCTMKLLEIFEGLVFYAIFQFGSKYVKDPNCSFPYHLFVLWKIWLLSGSYGAIVYWFLSLHFIFWYDILFFGREFKLVYINSALPKQYVMVCADGPRRYVTWSPFKIIWPIKPL
jgi:hypothetical protein